MPNLIVPPFTATSAKAKVQLAEDSWNTKDPELVALAYSEDSKWRDRDEFFEGRDAIRAFLYRKWRTQLHYQLIKELWAFHKNRISVRFEYEWQASTTGRWWRTHGNEHWEFDAEGLMTRRDMSANDIAIVASERRIGSTSAS